MDDKVLEELDALVEQKQDMHALNKLIEHYEIINDPVSLEHYYKKALEFNPYDPKALNNLSVIYADYFKRYDKAEKFYQKTLQLVDYEPQVHYNYAVLLEYHSKNYELAKQHYLKSLSLDPHFIESYIHLAWLFIDRLQDVDSAYEVLLKGIEHNKNSAVLHTDLAFIQSNYYAEFEQAEKNLKVAIQLDSDYDIAYTYLGELYTFLQDFGQATYYYNKALNCTTQSELLFVNYGNLLVNYTYDLDNALKLYEEAVRRFPKKGVFYCNISHVQILKGNVLEAKRYLDLAYETSNDDEETLMMIGYLRSFVEENPKNSIDYFEKLLEMNPNSVEALSILGFYHLFEDHDYETATAYFNKIIEINDTLYVIKFALAGIYSTYFKDYHKALDTYLSIDQTVLSEMERIILNFSMGQIYEKNLKDYHSALEYYEKAYEIKPIDFIGQAISNLYDSKKTFVN